MLHVVKKNSFLYVSHFTNYAQFDEMWNSPITAIHYITSKQ